MPRLDGAVMAVLRKQRVDRLLREIGQRSYAYPEVVDLTTAVLEKKVETKTRQATLRDFLPLG